MFMFVHTNSVIDFVYMWSVDNIIPKWKHKFFREFLRVHEHF